MTGYSCIPLPMKLSMKEAHIRRENSISITLQFFDEEEINSQNTSCKYPYFTNYSQLYGDYIVLLLLVVVRLN